MSESPPDGSGADVADREPEHRLTCDFCGETAPTVRRIALDGDYDRLQTPHAVRYACPDCSKRKERERRDREGASGS
jgi:hypothetical protein